MDYIAIIRDEKPFKIRINKQEKFDDISDAKRFLASTIANIIDDELDHWKIDIFDTEYKKFFENYGGKARLINRYNLEFTSALHLQFYIDGYNHRPVSFEIIGEEDYNKALAE